MLLLLSNVPSFLRSEATALNWRRAKSLKCISPFQISSASHCKITMSSTAVRAGNGNRQKEKYISVRVQNKPHNSRMCSCVEPNTRRTLYYYFRKEILTLKGTLHFPTFQNDSHPESCVSFFGESIISAVLSNMKAKSKVSIREAASFEPDGPLKRTIT